MNFWDLIINFHEMSHIDHENGKKGLLAVKYIRNVFEEFNHNLTPSHHLVTRLRASYAQNYEWLIQFAHKLHLLRSIEGSEELFSRLGKTNEFHQTMAEIEVALKLTLAKCKVLFVNRTPQHKTPDMLVKHDLFDFNIEVTTLNHPEENDRLNALHNRILSIIFGYRGTIKVSGIIARPPESREIDTFIQLFKDRVEEAIRTNKLTIANEPGLATVYIAPKEVQGNIPENAWRQFRFNPKYARPIEDRITDRIHKKTDQLYYQDRPGLLVLYSGTSYWDSNTLFRDSDPKIDLVLSTYLNVMGMVLTHHQSWGWGNYGTASKSKTQTSGNKILIELAPAVQEYEATIIWKNTHSNNCLPHDIIQSYKNYQNNLFNLDFPKNDLGL